MKRSSRLSYRNPVIATALNLVFGVPIMPIDGSSANNRTDLTNILLKYPGQRLDGTKCGYPCSELLRLDLSVQPTPPEKQNRLGAALSNDPAGWPNGRRPNDDVTDIAVRVVGGKNYHRRQSGRWSELPRRRSRLRRHGHHGQRHRQKLSVPAHAL